MLPYESIQGTTEYGNAGNQRSKCYTMKAPGSSSLAVKCVSDPFGFTEILI